MKKFLFVCVILFIANIGCKKMNIDGGAICGCSPVRGPELYLVIKNSAGEDLLDNKIVGAYPKDKIELYRKDENGNVIPVIFAVRPPFYYGNEKFNSSSLFSPDMNFLKKSGDNIIYLKLGADKLYELNLSLNLDKYDVDKLLIDKKEAEKNKGNVSKYASIFYLTL